MPSIQQALKGLLLNKMKTIKKKNLKMYESQSERKTRLS